MKLALYTTIYPGVEAYFQDWKNTVLSQTDKGFDLWVGVDGFEKSDAEALLAGLPNYQLVFNDVSHSKAAIRRKSLKKIAAAYDGVVLVDSDDRLLPTRISSAREYLKQYDVVGCPMALVNESGVEMGQTFGLKRRFSADQDILYANRFGLSNTAYRCDLLDRCLSMPDEAELFDWYLATVAWLHDAKIIFDHDIQMQYRQYDNNTTQVLGPFSSENILSSAKRSLLHYRSVLENVNHQSIKTRLLKTRFDEVESFYKKMASDNSILDQYAEELNQLEDDHIWWSNIANKKLEYLWK